MKVDDYSRDYELSWAELWVFMAIFYKSVGGLSSSEMQICRVIPKLCDRKRVNIAIVNFDFTFTTK
jgi:hypothetical protein